MLRLAEIEKTSQLLAEEIEKTRRRVNALEYVKIPQMQASYIETEKGTGLPVPDLKGMGLKDAIFAIENNGYRCSYEGMGHVASQSPAAGTRYTKGETIRIVLK